MGELHSTPRKAIRDLIDALRPTSRQAKLQPICWVGGDGDCGPDYCPECVEIVAAELNYANPEGSAIADGGWEDARESDHTAACERCGCSLGYSLSQYGLEQELEHWLESPPCAPVRPIDAYDIEAMLEAAEYCSDPKIVSATMKVGRAAVAALNPTASLVASTKRGPV